MASFDKPKVTAEKLYGYAAELNRLPWVPLTGGLYFVSKRPKPGSEFGETERFLDRHDGL